MLQQSAERVFGPFLFFCALLLLAWFTQGGSFLIGWGGLACLVTVFIIANSDDFRLSSLQLPALLFVAWLLLDILLLNPARHPDSLYPPLALLLGLLIFTCVPRHRIGDFFIALVSLLALLALHGMMQSFFHWGYLGNDTWPRATSIIFVPNNYATLLNTGLLPLIALYLLQKPGKILLTVIITLFAAMLLSQSRGGQIAFLAGMAVILIVYARTRPQQRSSWHPLAIGLLGTTASIELLKVLLNTSGLFERMARAVIDKGSSRLELYTLTWNNILADPLTGIGYYNFRHYFQRDKLPDFADKVGYFVHNDYLQIWLETGLIGLLLLLGVIAAFYWQISRNLSDSFADDKTITVAAGASATTIFVHAMVDYPLYLPLLMLLVGATIAVAGKASARVVRSNSLNIPLVARRSSRIIIGFLILWWPAQHVIAQYYANQAIRNLLELDLTHAVESITLARRFAPRDDHFAFSAGTIWLNAAHGAQNREAAEEADRMFALGTSLNPYEVKSLVQRLKLHRDHPHLLAAPVDDGTLKEWTEKIINWQPDNDSYALEHAKTLVHIGANDKARAFIEEYWRNGLIDNEQRVHWVQQLNLYTLNSTGSLKKHGN